MFISSTVGGGGGGGGGGRGGRRGEGRPGARHSPHLWVHTDEPPPTRATLRGARGGDQEGVTLARMRV